MESFNHQLCYIPKRNHNENEPVCVLMSMPRGGGMEGKNKGASAGLIKVSGYEILIFHIYVGTQNGGQKHVV